MRRILSSLCLMLAILALCLGVLPRSAAASSASDIASVMDRIETIVTKLALDDTLDSKETDNLRKELAAIYRDLEQIKNQLPANAGGSGSNQGSAGTGGGSTAVSNKWKDYSNATLDMTPAYAQFKGWQSGYSISSGFADETGTIRVVIDNVKYKATWSIRDAYAGNVKTSTNVDKSGDVTLTVKDEEGEHRFLIRNGGTGPLYYSDEGGNGGKSVNPVDNQPVKQTGPQSKPSGEPIPGKWYQGYRDMVAAKQLEQSEAMEWFIDQANRYDYVSDALRDIGQKCKSLEGLGAVSEVGTFRYYSAGQPKKLSIPDPRVSPANFVFIINKAYILQNAGEWYKADIE